jgi:cytochrome P450
MSQHVHSEDDRDNQYPGLGSTQGSFRHRMVDHRFVAFTRLFAFSSILTQDRTIGHMDSKVWTDPNDLHPVDTFWPGRFLRYPKHGGPAEFSMMGKESSWLSFGSGANLCPGRQFAKIHCVVTLALMVDSFDCDVLAGPKDLKLDLRKFGMGVLGPSGKVSARLRRRTTNP